MSSRRFPLVGGRVMRGTRLDACGRPAWGDKAQIASEGFVSVAVTANYDDGTEKTVTNAGGKKCVNVPANPELTNLEVEVTFCEVDPEFYTLVTGMPAIHDPVTGDAIGFRINRGVRPMDVAWALEVWSDAQGSAACDASGAIPYGYLLWPFLSGAKVGDYTIEDNAITFTVSGAITRDGSGWAEGPYLVVEDGTGAAAQLAAAIEALDHQIVVRTEVAPPLPTAGLIPLDDPDLADATSANAGIPGTWEPDGAVRPADLAALQASGITASPATAWTTGQYVYLGDGSKAHWTGTAWAAGAAT